MDWCTRGTIFEKRGIRESHLMAMNEQQKEKLLHDIMTHLDHDFGYTRKVRDLGNPLLNLYWVEMPLGSIHARVSKEVSEIKKKAEINTKQLASTSTSAMGKRKSEEAQVKTTLWGHIMACKKVIYNSMQKLDKQA